MTVTTWRYHLPPRNGWGGWATFLLDSNGMLAVASDYGNFVYHWPTGGWGPGDFREFLVDLDTSYYLPTKLSNGHREYDGQATHDAIKREILRRRRKGECSAQSARNEWELLRDYDVTTKFGLVEWLQNTSINDAAELSRDRIDRHLDAFLENAWPRFCEVVRGDLAANDLTERLEAQQ